MIRERGICGEPEHAECFLVGKLELYILEKIGCFPLYRKTLNTFHHPFHEIGSHVGMQGQRDYLLHRVVRH